MINNLIKISKEKERLEERFLKSLFIKRIDKILSNLRLNDLKLKVFKIDRREIKLIYTFYIGCNEYSNLSLTLPIKMYFKKYNIILKYILDNINDYDLFWNLEEYKDKLSKSFISFSKEKKLRIKDLNRILHYIFINNPNLVIQSLTKYEFSTLNKELETLQQIKEF